MMRTMLMACAAVMALAGAPLATGPAAAQTAAQAAPTQRQLDLTRQYLRLTMSEQFDSAIREMIVDQISMDPTADNLPAEDRRFLTELTAELTTDMIPQMLEQMVPVYARTFTEAELDAMIAFFSSDVGRSVTEKSIIAMPEANRQAMTVVPQMMEKMAARICQHYGCTPAELEEMRRSISGADAAAPAARTK